MSDNSIEKEFYIRQHRLEHQTGIDNNFDTDYLIANTAILGGNSNIIKELKFFKIF